MQSVSEAMRELDEITRELAVVTEALAGPRMKWRRLCDRIAEECMALDHGNKRLAAWQPMGRDNIAKLDAGRQEYLAIARPLLPEEARLKSARRDAEASVATARKAQLEAAKSPAKATPQRPSGAQQMTLF